MSDPNFLGESVALVKKVFQSKEEEEEEEGFYDAIGLCSQNIYSRFI